MRSGLRLPVMLVAVLLSAVAQAGEGTRPRAVGKRPCPHEAPEGVRPPERPDCTTSLYPAARETDGFRDIGGVHLRIGGRVSATYGAGR